MMTVWWQGTIKETKSKGADLKKYPFFDWQPVKCFEQWSIMFKSALARFSDRKKVPLRDFELFAACTSYHSYLR